MAEASRELQRVQDWLNGAVAKELAFRPRMRKAVEEELWAELGVKLSSYWLLRRLSNHPFYNNTMKLVDKCHMWEEALQGLAPTSQLERVLQSELATAIDDGLTTSQDGYDDDEVADSDDSPEFDADIDSQAQGTALEEDETDVDETDYEDEDDSVEDVLTDVRYNGQPASSQPPSQPLPHACMTFPDEEEFK